MRENVSARARERAVGRLQRGYACGDLGTETFERRLDLALRADCREALRRAAVDFGRPSVADRLRAWLTPRDPAVAASGLLEALAPGRPAVIGRAQRSDLVLPDQSVSRRHAMLVRDGDRVVLTDLGSTNGTHLNGRWVRQAEVRPGDRLRLGDVEIVL